MFMVMFRRYQWRHLFVWIFMVEQIVKTCTFHRKFAVGFTRPTLVRTYLPVRRKDMTTLSALKATSNGKDSNHQDNQMCKGDGKNMVKKMKTVHTVAVSVVPTNRATDAVSLDDDDDESLETWKILQKIRTELKDPGFYR